MHLTYILTVIVSFIIFKMKILYGFWINYLLINNLKTIKLIPNKKLDNVDIFDTGRKVEYPEYHGIQSNL